MTCDLYLLWIPGQGSAWGVFDTCGCPDPGAFPNWMYRKYSIPKEQERKVFNKLR